VSTRRRLSVAIVVLGCAVLALVSLRSGGGPSGPDGSEDGGAVAEPTGTAPEAPAAPLLAGAHDGARSSAPGLDVAGTVRRRDGTPAPFALVSLIGAPDPVTEERTVLVRTTASADGTYLVRISSRPPGFTPSSAHLVSAARDGKERSAPRVLSAARPQEGAPSRLDLLLVPSGVLHGVVRAKGGAPIPTATFRLRSSSPERGEGWGPTTWVAADGSFRLEGLLGEIGMAWSAPGFAQQGRLTRVNPGAEVKFDAVLSPREGGASGAVRVTDEEGRPVPDVSVRAEAPAFTPERSLGRTDADGAVPFTWDKAEQGMAFRLDLEGTPWMLDPEDSWEGRVRVHRAEPSVPIVIRLLRAARVRGRVRTASDRPVGPGFPVTFGDVRGVRVETDAEGRFVVPEPLPPGRCHLDLVTQESATTLVPGENDLDLRVHDVVGFDLLPVDSVTGERWAAEESGAAEVPWPAFRQFRIAAAPDPEIREGWIELGVDPSSGRLRGWGTPGEESPQVLLLRTRVRTFSAPLPPLPPIGGSLQARVPVDLDNHGRMQGRVRDLAGERPTGFRIAIDFVPASGAPRSVGGLQSVERDEFLVGPIGAGRYHLRVTGLDAGAAERTVEVVVGKTIDVGEIVLGAATPR
jgi:hypothetical protein